MKNSTTSDKVLMRKCEDCTVKIDSRLLFTVRDRKICLECWNKEVDRWNEMVREAESR